LYQIVSRINPDLDNQRFIENINLGKYAELLKNDNNIDLTSIMYVNGQQYGFVLKTNTTRIINCNKLRFEVTTSIIDNKTKNVSTNLPSGFFKNAVTLVNNISYSPDECPFPSDKNYYNSFVSGNINIQKEGDDQYRITFKKSGMFTSYQIRNSNVRTREILNYSPENWVNNFSNNLGLTCLMRLKNGCIYGFVLTNTFYKNNIMTWFVTTNQIFNKSSTVANGFKTGNFNDVIFDIDPNTCPQDGEQYFTQQPINPSFISSPSFNSTKGVLNFTVEDGKLYTFTFYPFKLETVSSQPLTVNQACPSFSFQTCCTFTLGLNNINYSVGTAKVGTDVKKNIYQDFGLSSSNLPFRLFILAKPLLNNSQGLFYCDLFTDNKVIISQPQPQL
jgi:hypothetical protein